MAPRMYEIEFTPLLSPSPRLPLAGVTGLYELQVMLLSRVSSGDGLADLSGSSTFGGGGLTAQYYTNARLAGRPLVTRVCACFPYGRGGMFRGFEHHRFVSHAPDPAAPWKTSPFFAALVSLPSHAPSLSPVDDPNCTLKAPPLPLPSSLTTNSNPFELAQIDPAISLDWGSGVPAGVSRVGSTGGAVGVRWDGFVKAPLSGEFTFTITTRAGDEARYICITHTNVLFHGRDGMSVPIPSCRLSSVVRCTYWRSSCRAEMVAFICLM